MKKAKDSLSIQGGIRCPYSLQYILDGSCMKSSVVLVTGGFEY